MTDERNGQETLKANLKKFLIAIMEEETRNNGEVIHVIGQELKDELTKAVGDGFKDENVTQAVAGSIAHSFKSEDVQDAIAGSFGAAVHHAVQKSLTGAVTQLQDNIGSQIEQVHALRQEVSRLSNQVASISGGKSKPHDETYRADTGEASGSGHKNDNGKLGLMGLLRSVTLFEWALIACIAAILVIGSLIGINVFSRDGGDVAQKSEETTTVAKTVPEVEKKEENKRRQQKKPKKYELSKVNFEDGLQGLSDEALLKETPGNTGKRLDELNNICGGDGCAGGEVWPTDPKAIKESKYLRETLAQIGTEKLYFRYDCKGFAGGFDGVFGSTSLGNAERLLKCMNQKEVFGVKSKCFKSSVVEQRALCLLERLANDIDTSDKKLIITKWIVAEVGRSEVLKK